MNAPAPEVKPLYTVNQEGKLSLYLHPGQSAAHQARERIIAMLAGSQGGKTSYGPFWQWAEILETGGGDHLAVTASFDLFKLKMLPAMLEVFEESLGIGRYWPSDRVLEICEGGQPGGRFLATKSTDKMWGRVILRSAESLSGLESATARSAWLDEAGQDSFSIQTYRAIRRRLALYRGRILITTTLYNIGWLKQIIIDKAENGGKASTMRWGEAEMTITQNGREGIYLIQYDSILNPLYPREEYEEARASLPDDDFQMFYKGRVARLRHLIYDCYDPMYNACHRFPIPAHWPRYVGLDFGAVHTAALFLAEEPQTGRLFAYREYLAGSRTSHEHAEKIMEGEPGIPYAVGGAKSEAQWRAEFAAAGLPINQPSVESVDVGIGRVYAQVKKKKLIFFNDLHGVLDQIQRYRRKRGKDGEPTEEIENKAAFHYLDALRYVVGTVRDDTVWAMGMAS